MKIWTKKDTKDFILFFVVCLMLFLALNWLTDLWKHKAEDLRSRIKTMESVKLSDED